MIVAAAARERTTSLSQVLLIKPSIIQCKHEFCWVCMEPWKIHNSETGGYFRYYRLEIHLYTHGDPLIIFYTCGAGNTNRGGMEGATQCAQSKVEWGEQPLGRAARSPKPRTDLLSCWCV